MIGWGKVLAAQRTDGAFPSFVHLADGPTEDINGFATALVLDMLWQAPDTPAVVMARDRAAHFLLRCEHRDKPGHFGFYPRQKQPDWMVAPLPADADDTALFASLLFHAGLMNRARLATIVEQAILPQTVLYLSERSAPWHRVGAVETWLDETLPNNPVDCTVNLNVLTLMQLSGEHWPEMDAITDMLYAAQRWADTAEARCAMLSPWYPHPSEMLWALRRAMRAGVPGLRALRERWEGADWARPDKNPPICGSSDRRILWTCPAVTTARDQFPCHFTLT